MDIYLIIRRVCPEMILLKAIRKPHIIDSATESAGQRGEIMHMTMIDNQITFSFYTVVFNELQL